MRPCRRDLLLAGACLALGASGLHQEAGEVRVDAIPGTEVEFRMVFVPGGTFTMGSAAGSVGHEPDEAPTVAVTLQPFWVGATEVTFEEFEIFRYRGLDDHIGARDDIEYDADAVSRPTPPYEDPGHGGGQGSHPAVGMTRRAALFYARWLSEKTGRLYRLPTEAEWEYVCRAGGGGDASSAGGAWTSDNSEGAHHPAAELAPNAWGVHDMLGNVSEWVLDTYSDDAYAAWAEGVTDPVAGEPPRGRGIVRGGGYDDPLMRCAERLPELAAWKRRDPQIPKSPWWNTDSPHVGFRLVSPAADMSMAEIRAYWEELLGS